MTRLNSHPAPAEIQAAVGHRERIGAMIAVFVTFHFGDDFSAAQVRRIAENARAKFEGMPGLRSKLFSVFPERREARNVYVWDDPEAARRFLTPESRDRIAALYCAQPTIEYAEVCALVDNSHVRTTQSTHTS